MKKYLSVLVLIFLSMSCKDEFKAEYFFPENNVSFYAVIFNSKSGITAEKSNGKYEYNFEKSNILFVKEAQLTGIGNNFYYLIGEDNAVKKEIVAENDFVPKNNQTVIYFHTLASYTIAKTNQQVDYEMFWLAPNKKMSDKEQIEEDKRQNIQIQLLHQKIDSLVNVGLL